eukprot:CAMPEP_0179612822 /NCGR_PEP_ID=MMETSP0930-20121108/4727_1 /TAXON_ID=548131 ORGANISM="Ostreococcus mediterraneus, Strain clade-D-RCC1621" /NCGR_SAMPLE_ID=MMETSP0930 /ASSEMBLY_ACC=CAM_ASM_000580 /LENGTH=242 /DNA_ID=CAMNT_0021481479 /DNA_START=1320 /DNA_END=2048 /DNA_ORIENTATION=-
MFCMSDALMDHSTGLSFGNNSGMTVKAWKTDLMQFFHSNNDSKILSNLLPTLVKHTSTGRVTQIHGKHADCLRMAIFLRQEGKRRAFANLNEVIKLMEEYTCRPVEFFNISSTSTGVEAIQTMNDFDVLVTPHGSHLTNGIFILTRDGVIKKPSIIEVVATCYNEDFLKNLRTFANYRITAGHDVQDARLQNLLIACEQRKNCEQNDVCNNTILSQAKGSDLLVNITILRHALEEAVAIQKN